MPGPLSIIFQDEWLVAVHKPPGQLVHPADEPQPDDLVTMKILRDQIGQHIHTIHRIDRPTSGTLLFATDADAARSLRQAFENQQIEKSYFAIVNGRPSVAGKEFSVDLPLQKSEDSPSKAALTHFRVLDELPYDFTTVEARPATGRFHQIRRHLAHLGHPILGDFRYQGERQELGILTELQLETRMFLQSRCLSMTHPVTGEPLRIESPLDDDFSLLLAKLMA